MYSDQRSLELLRIGTAIPDAVFRDGQSEAIRHVVEGRGRLLVVQKTGWGKSAVYFVATKLLREQGAGPAILISPLIALMRNQLSAAERMGVHAATINSSNLHDWDTVKAEILANTVDILLISPERLANADFVANVLAPVSAEISLLVVDEAHCISDWGHDFRPDYRRIERIIENLPPNLRVLATTATANNRVLEDLRGILGPGLSVSRGGLGRPSLLLQTLRISDQAGRLAWLATHIPRIQGSGIVYTLTVRDAEHVAAWLRTCGINAASYTGQSENREALENALLENKIKCLVATTALGMGFDKPDLAFVIHYQTPGSVVAYYQQVGRAGRAIDSAHGVLLSGPEEDDINDYFINSAFPTPEHVQAILDQLHAAPSGLSVYDLLRKLNISKQKIEHALKLLALESPPPAVNESGKWMLTSAPLAPTFWERARRLTDLRRAEQRQMHEYIGLTKGHMEFLMCALDGDPTGYRPPDVPPLPKTYDLALAQSAGLFLRRSHHPLDLKKQWPSGGMPLMGVKGKLDESVQAESGRILCVWEDAGWGALVRDGKCRDGKFDDRLIAACVDMIREWNPAPQPTWVTCIPSLRHPGLVPDFARRLAVALGLPFLSVFTRIAERAEQVTCLNSAQQALNVDSAFTVNAPVPDGVALLVDDTVNSGWTLTVATYLLRSHGSGPVFPLALASDVRTSAYTKNLLVLANSVKNHAHCVAGIEIDSCDDGSSQPHTWIRPISRHGDGELSDSECTLADGAQPRPGDIVTVGLCGKADIATQRENHFINQGSRWLKTGACSPQDFQKLVESPNDLWLASDETTDRIAPDALATHSLFGRSLLMLAPDNGSLSFWAWQTIEQGQIRRHRKAVFVYNGVSYELSLTDPTMDTRYLAPFPAPEEAKRMVMPPDNQRMLLVVSLTPQYADGFHYKVVATVLEY